VDVPTTAALSVNKPEATAVVIARWLQVLNTAFSYYVKQTTHHWLSPTICFAVIGWGLG